MKNLIGNTLTVLILLMSCFFFAAALMLGAAQRNWKAEVTALTSRAEAAERQVNDAKSTSGEQKKAIEREKVARAQQIATLFSQRRVLTEQLADRQKILKVEIESNQSRLAQLDEAQRRLDQQDKELADVKARNKDLKADISEQFSKVQLLTQETFEQQTKIDSLEQTVGDLNSSLALRTKVMNAKGIDVYANVSHIVPKMTGVIVEIGSSRKTFTIKLGSDDGVRVGHEFDVYRNNRFIARAAVSKVREDICVLKLVEGLTQSPIQKGDYVTSEL